jgi:transcriptional regulator
VYIPPSFAETDLDKIQNFVERHSFGLLVSQVDGQPFASHLPMLLDWTTGRFGTLIGHMARQNPQWREADGTNVLAVFSGPHVYVSPSWYEAEKVVPTWNYVAVHAGGKFQPIEEENALLDIVQRTTTKYEGAMPKPWSFDGSAHFVERLLGQIVGFRIEIDKIEGKWKLNQNHPAERRAKVVRALQGQGDENSLAIAELIQEKLSGDSG